MTDPARTPRISPPGCPGERVRGTVAALVEQPPIPSDRCGGLMVPKERTRRELGLSGRHPEVAGRKHFGRRRTVRPRPKRLLLIPACLLMNGSARQGTDPRGFTPRRPTPAPCRARCPRSSRAPRGWSRRPRGSGATGRRICDSNALRPETPKYGGASRKGERGRAERGMGERWSRW